MEDAGRSAAERRFAGERFIQGDAETVNIGAGIDRVGNSDLLGADVGGRAGDVSFASQSRGLLNEMGEAKVEQTCTASVGVEEEVGGLDVAMEKAGSVSGCEALGSLRQRCHRVPGFEPLLQADAGSQRHARDVFHHDIRQRAGLVNNGVNGNDRLVPQSSNGLGLADQPSARRFGVELWPQDLDGHSALEAVVMGAEDNAHAAATNLFQDAVRAEAAELAGQPRRPQHGSGSSYLPRLVPVGGRLRNAHEMSELVGNLGQRAGAGRPPLPQFRIVGEPQQLFPTGGTTCDVLTAHQHFRLAQLSREKTLQHMGQQTGRPVVHESASVGIGYQSSIIRVISEWNRSPA
jgi:hypothetical protein